MATSLTEIAHFLDNRNWNYHVDVENSKILTGVKAENVDELLIVIKISEDGEFLHLYTPQLLSVKDHCFKGVVFQTMLNISWQSKMIRFEYDTSDGEVRASIELPLEDAVLTERQFNRCLSGLIQLVDDSSMPRLKSVLATGIDPGSKDISRRLAEEMPEDILSLMEEIVRHRQSGPA